MSKTFEFERFDAETTIRDGVPDVAIVPDAEGDFVRAQDAIDREKFNAGRILALEAQLEIERAKNDGEAAIYGAKTQDPISERFGINR